MQAGSVNRHVDPNKRRFSASSPSPTSGDNTAIHTTTSNSTGTPAPRTPPKVLKSPEKYTTPTNSFTKVANDASFSRTAGTVPDGREELREIPARTQQEASPQKKPRFAATDSILNSSSSAFGQANVGGKSTPPFPTPSPRDTDKTMSAQGGAPFAELLGSMGDKSWLPSAIGLEGVSSKTGTNEKYGINLNRNERKIGTSMISTAATWAQRLSKEFLCCQMCQKPCVDPVQCIPKRSIVCRECFYSKGLYSSSLQELPVSLLNLVTEIQQQASTVDLGRVVPISSFSFPVDEFGLTSSSNNGQRPMKEANGDGMVGPGNGEQGLHSLETASSAVLEEERHTGAEMGMTRTGPSPAAAEKDERPASSSPVLIHNAAASLSSLATPGTPGEPLEKGKTGVTNEAAGATTTPLATTPPPNSSGTTVTSTITPSSTSTGETNCKEGSSLSGSNSKGLKSDPSDRESLDLVDETYVLSCQQTIYFEEKERQNILMNEERAALSMFSRLQMQMQAAGDKFFGNSNYGMAVLLYTHAIRLSERAGLPGISTIYFNRSAAYSRLLQHQKCCDDCSRGIEHDQKEERVVKMCMRGARGSCAQAKFAQAICFLERVPESGRDSNYKKDIEKYQKAKYILVMAEKAFGTPDADHYFRMLITLFNSSYAIRLRFGQSLMQQNLFREAIDVLSFIPQDTRPPVYCAALAECYYKSGFEFFKDAKEVLRSAAALDAECRQLLDKICHVDREKQAGNDAFARRYFDVAIKHYTNSILVAHDNKWILRILYSNRAAGKKELGKYEECIEDCSKSLENDPSFYKAYARRARCHLELSDPFAAVEDFKKAIENDKAAEDPNLRRELQEAEKRLAQEDKREKDYYYQLGVEKNATMKDIKLKFRELSLKWHPDKCVGKSEAEKERAEIKFKRINEAYSILSDPQRRREHDYKYVYGNLGNSFSFSRNRNPNTNYSYF